MPFDLIPTVEESMAQSELALTVAAARLDPVALVGLSRLRPLFPEEIARLESLGNTCANWARIRVTDGFNWRRVQSNSFHGEVVLGELSGRVSLVSGVEVPTGIYHSTVANCVIGNNALVQDVKLLANYVVGEGAVLMDCGWIACDGPTEFGNGLALPIGIESGGRDMPIYAEMTLEVAAALAQARWRRLAFASYARLIAEFRARVRSSRGIIQPGATVRGTPKLHNTYLGHGARVEGAALVADSTVLSSRDEPAQILSGACVTHSLVQWGSQVATMAIVDRSVLTEHAQVERHAKVTNSILGPNTAVAGGEVTASLLGPFVGFHHQALVIAALWPEGKGNVGYGANVGSNHTAKAPDQEFWPGEGTFLGLGVNIKYPADFSKAPYSIIASGVTMLPQKLAFPFSLINTPSQRWRGISPAFNEIVPAWQLTDNLYALRRCEEKYRTRNQARRTHFDFRVFRADTVQLMRDACRRLNDVPHRKKVYTEKDIPGLGKNYLLEPCRRRALAAYQFFIRLYGLLDVKARVETALQEKDETALGRLLEPVGKEPDWRRREGVDPSRLDVKTALGQLSRMLEIVARRVEESKAKDDERGPRIIEDYAEVHLPAQKDPLVIQSWKRTRQVQAEIKKVLIRLEKISADRVPLVNPAVILGVEFLSERSPTGFFSEAGGWGK